MDVRALAETTAALLAGGKGLLAMAESNQTCNRRFATFGIAQDEDTRRAYREMIVTTPDLGGSIRGAILCDETIHQRMSKRRPPRRIPPGHGSGRVMTPIAFGRTHVLPGRRRRA